ncbi:hypothetical protein [Lentzea jiangxiensis]|uniref:Uncharacterized protein n=1 Tax=Lentzea jiangxiensis TaxID=641025 RepID=A0A1H0X3V5_9PSEU|nr:hypothetical protein [Lentzea jiangxiensis]SDP97405.1 hypothetical protein SAMN05421507_1315 [Lentzea jiangxiensis]
MAFRRCNVSHQDDLVLPELMSDPRYTFQDVLDGQITWEQLENDDHSYVS